MSIELPIDIDQIKGFLADDEGEALYQYAQQEANKLGPSAWKWAATAVNRLCISV